MIIFDDDFRCTDATGKLAYLLIFSSQSKEPVGLARNDVINTIIIEKSYDVLRAIPRIDQHNAWLVECYCSFENVKSNLDFRPENKIFFLAISFLGVQFEKKRIKFVL